MMPWGCELTVKHHLFALSNHYSTLHSDPKTPKHVQDRPLNTVHDTIPACNAFYPANWHVELDHITRVSNV